MGIPRRLRQQSDRYALVDGVPFHLPINCERSPALFAVFPIDYEKARAAMPGNEVHPFRLWNSALLVVSVMDYRITDIGKYIEFSVAIACTHGSRPAPRLLPAVFMHWYGTGQYVIDLPVSTEISVKGGKGIWGMPKHQANLDYTVTETAVSSQYDLDGKLVARIELDRPSRAWVPINVGAANYCAFRGMLMKSLIYFRGSMGFHLMKKGSARFILGSHPRADRIRALDIKPDPLFVGFIPEANGVLDDYLESWFISFATAPGQQMEGLESVVGLGLSEEWLDPPTAKE